MNLKKRKRFITAIVVLALVIVALCGGLGYGYTLFKDLGVARDKLEQEIEANKQYIYVALKPIEAGEIITDEGADANVMLQQNLIGLEPYNFIDETYLGSKAVVKIEEGYPILVGMVTDVTLYDDTREYEVLAVQPMTTQKDYDFVDVRIMFPNGEDYLVLSKKQIHNMALESCVFTTEMNEEEILRYASAVIDAYVTTGAKLYTTRYLEASLQKEATPTYLVRQETIDLMNSDPNVVTLAEKTLNRNARNLLEARMSGLTEEQLEAVANGHGLADTASNSVILASEEEDVVEEHMYDEYDVTTPNSEPTTTEPILNTDIGADTSTTTTVTN